MKHSRTYSSVSTRKEEDIQVLQRDPVPIARRQDSSFLSRWTYSYFYQLVERGAKRELTPQDYAPIEDMDACRQLSTRLSMAWKQEWARNGNQPKKGMLWKVLFHVFGWQYLSAAP
ncbi:hypothetical protein HDU91_002116, partial [Kappamyces sp. JEL0680]